MDALTLVRQDHRRLEGLLQRVERHDGAEERGVLFGQLRSAVDQHRDLEEHILYPIFRERARRAEVDLAPLDRALEQHRLIDRLAGELAAADGDGLQAKITVLAEQLRNHLDTEDSAVLTAIEDLLDDDTLLELGRRMEQRDRVVAARRELARTLPAEGRRLAAVGALAAAGAALLALLARRRRPPRRRTTGRARGRRR
jgi:hemerythrin-like domain-containing protein